MELTSILTSNEKKSARLEIRTQPIIKETIKRAANLSGVDISSFTSSAAYEAARLTVQAQSSTVLESQADRDAFFNALEKPAKPTKELTKAFARHKELVASED